MAFKWVNTGLDFFEESIIGNGFTDVMDTVAVGDGTSAPNSSDTSLSNNLFEADTTSNNVTIERGGATGEIRVTIEFTGGVEVPADSDISEFGLKTNTGTLVYREVRDSAVNVASGETKIIEIRAFVEDAPSSGEQVITDVGREFIADRVIGDSTDSMDIIAIGNGTSNVSSTDTSMFSELYRANESSGNITLSETTTVGEIRAEITVSAGDDADDEVSADASISEFGLITGDGTLILHETRTGLTLENNDEKTFKIPFDIIQ